MAGKYLLCSGYTHIVFLRGQFEHIRAHSCILGALRAGRPTEDPQGFWNGTYSLLGLSQFPGELLTKGQLYEYVAWQGALGSYSNPLWLFQCEVKWEPLNLLFPRAWRVLDIILLALPGTSHVFCYFNSCLLLHLGLVAKARIGYTDLLRSFH